ncbi:ATP-binding protein [Chryseobacterium sp. EO14]|uniref:ATP-binding protein n=1 Tax=Chryseobacterium sp. EO14 TaxID=2950551 RepID=UPI002108D880|nr:ATP-binding protein [Chryseobacterium sp. EO14]MCQ4140422.1 ATP-binding protein [Chryseobacterium sp. EO14]
MNLKKVNYLAKLTSKSIESSGLPSDYKKSIAEYIWNGFDAGASIININFESNEIGYLNYFSIGDNGSGINFNNIDETFGNFNDSIKSISFSESGFIKGKKGKGRYSFVTFCNHAIWDTKFREEKNKILHYFIEINKENSQNFSIYGNEVIKETKTWTGTTVTFSEFHSLTSDLIDNDDFRTFLSSEFGWFLYLNKKNDFKILINGISIPYFDIIAENEDLETSIGDKKFKISYIRWKNKIGDKYYYYFLNSDKKQIARKHTSFNNKTENFHHSIYIESEYFNSFKITEEDISTLDFAEKNQTDYVFKALVNILNTFISAKEKSFIRDHQAEKLIEQYNKKNIFPPFKNNNYEQLRKKDLENVIRELYSVQPKIFQNLRDTQSKTIVGFLNLLLDTEQRENILIIIDSVVKLDEKEREELAKILQNTKLSHITSLVKFLANRYEVVEILKKLIYELERFTNEREHIQKIIENNYWLFGEQYHLVSADMNFEIVLNNYLHFIENRKGEEKPKNIENKNKLKRPDIFISRKIDLPNSENDLMIEDNIMVELKRPSVIIGKEQFSQIEDYMNIIVNTPEFNSQLRNWKFYIIGKEVDNYIKGLYKNQSVRNKKFLVLEVDNYEIYALTWDDLFRIFNNRHKNFIDKLEFKNSIIEELKAKGIAMNKEASDLLTSNIIKN